MRQDIYGSVNKKWLTTKKELLGSKLTVFRNIRSLFTEIDLSSVNWLSIIINIENLIEKNRIFSNSQIFTELDGDSDVGDLNIDPRRWFKKIADVADQSGKNRQQHHFVTNTFRLQQPSSTSM